MRRRPGPIRLAVVGGLSALFLAHSLPAQGAAFRPVAVYPEARAQPGEAGRILVTLRPFNGRLYAGFGDYGGDHGPIAIRAFDPAAGDFGPVLLQQRTEARCLLREIGGRLYAPTTDPLAGDDEGGFAMATPDAVDDRWSDHRPVTGYHFYDMATFDGSDLWLAGSRGSSAALWRSLDGGVTFGEPPELVESASSGVTRYYFVARYLDRLWVNGLWLGSSRVFDGTRWSEGPALLPYGGHGWHPEPFAGRLVYQQLHAGYGPSPMLVFDGTSARRLLVPMVYDFTIDGGNLLVLTARFVSVPGEPGGGHYLPDGVFATRDLCSWTRVPAAPPAQARSLGVLAGELFLGGLEGQLYRMDEPLSPALPGPPGLVRNLQIVRAAGRDLLLSWDPFLARESCQTYTILRADAPPALDLADFRSIATGISELHFNDGGAALRPFHAYLVQAESPFGRGPTGR